MIYAKEKLQEIIFPLGGIGTGSVGIAGNGSLVDWEIFNRPNKGSINGYSFFAVKAEFPDGKSVVRVLQGDWTKDLSGKYSKSFFTGYGFGPNYMSMCGFPHFEKVKFDGKFPIAALTFEDTDFPAKITMEAFNPFIPLDSDNSSIPAAFFDVKIKSFLDDVKYTVLFSVTNPFESSENIKVESDKYTAINMIHSGVCSDDKEYGDMTIAVEDKEAIYQEYWYRGGKRDPVTTFWREFSEGEIKNRRYNTANKADICTVGASRTVSKNKDEHIRFVLSWNVPNNYNYWKPLKDDDDKDVTWKNYYAVLFENSQKSCFYCFDNWSYLYKYTVQFCKSLHFSTLDNAVVDAVSSTLSVLKSSTVLRLEDGTFYGWEGVHEQRGSCEGTCTHVWGYAYALCFLFPELELSLRNTEFKYNTEESGEMHFRSELPLGRERDRFHPCLDGQMSTVIKIYRDWKLTGNSQWLRENWENIKKVLEFAWNEQNTYEWDRDKDGVLEGRQHHTLDMEIFGPSSWLESMYLAALKAASEMAGFLGETEKQKEYSLLFKKGYEWTKKNLFNGEYFFHKIELTNDEYTKHFNCPEYWNDEKGEIKYQIGEGCEIDQMLGQWHANICGLGDIFSEEQRKIALQSMMKNNFKKSMRDYANMWRVFALNDEAGAVICDYPEGTRKPIIPIPYCEECMTGFEYAFAGLLISEGFIDDGLKVVRAIRDRYDGKKRNPWNEIECGSNYARPMASFALLPIFSGFKFDLPQKHIGFAPIINGDFKCFWAVGTGWGNFVKKSNKYEIEIKFGSLELESVSLEDAFKIKKVFADGKPVQFTVDNDRVLFETVKAEKQIRFEM